MKLTYFSSGGRAYPIRTCFGIANIPFEDEKITFPQLIERRGPAGKSADIPMGAVPVLKLSDGKVITQSIAIARYAGKLAKLYPEDPLKALFVDEILETIADCLNGIPRSAGLGAEEFKKVREEFVSGKATMFFSYLAEKLQAEDGPFFFGSDYTLADLSLYQVLGIYRSGTFDHIPADFHTQWAVFDSFIKNYESHPILGQYRM